MDKSSSAEAGALMKRNERIHRRSLRRAPAAQAGPAAEQAQDCHRFKAMERYRIQLDADVSCTR